MLTLCTAYTPPFLSGNASGHIMCEGAAHLRKQVETMALIYGLCGVFLYSKIKG